jgi:hypothetical protein
MEDGDTQMRHLGSEPVGALVTERRRCAIVVLDEGREFGAVDRLQRPADGS